ncbi:hypothetical protein GH733_017785, partial [Mirounga leonina]
MQTKLSLTITTSKEPLKFLWPESVEACQPGDRTGASLRRALNLGLFASWFIQGWKVAVEKGSPGPDLASALTDLGFVGTKMAMASDLYQCYYIGQKDKFGHEFLEFEFWSSVQGLGPAVMAAASPLRELEGEAIFKKENIHHVWQMASLVENIWRMKVDEERPPREDRPLEQNAEKLCGLHLEKLHYYRKDDQQILCVMCWKVWEHRHHPAVLLEKAAQPYRGKILNQLKILKGDRDRIEKFQSTGEDELEALLTKFQNHRQGHQFLRERKQCLLELLEGIEQELAEGRNSHDPSDLVSRYPWKKFWIEKPISAAIKKWAEKFADKLLSLEKRTRGFNVRIVLNSQTANGYLSVSPNGKSMLFTGLWMNKYQHGQRFDPEPGVLGNKGFAWGKVYWKVKAARI